MHPKKHAEANNLEKNKFKQTSNQMHLLRRMCRKVLSKYVKEKFLKAKVSGLKQSVDTLLFMGCLKHTNYLDRCILHPVTFAHQITCLQKVRCPTQRFLYCFTVLTLTLLTIHISHVGYHNWYHTSHDNGCILSKEFWMHQIQWRSHSDICDLTVHWNQIKVHKNRNLASLHELFSAVFWQCIHLHYISSCCILIGSLFLGLPLWNF